MRFRRAYLLLLIILGASALQALDIGEHMITGFVREEGSSTPIAAATLEISGSGSQGMPPVISGTDGEFVFRGLQEGDYVITAKKTGFDPASISVAVRRTGVPQVTISRAGRLLRGAANRVVPSPLISCRRPRRRAGPMKKAAGCWKTKTIPPARFPNLRKP